MFERPIFCIGQNKTGTYSLHLAFQQLGIKSIHEHKVTKEALDKHARGEEGILRSVTCDYQAVLEQLWRPGIFKFLHEEYPGAKFVYTYRDIEDWVDSRIVHILHNRITKVGTWTEIDTKTWRQEYKKHENMVRNAFDGMGHKLLCINICAGDGWETLCPFLDAEIPNEPFPRQNTAINRLQRILDRKKRLE
jgi:hypothetical protein